MPRKAVGFATGILCAPEASFLFYPAPVPQHDSAPTAMRGISFTGIWMSQILRCQSWEACFLGLPGPAVPSSRIGNRSCFVAGTQQRNHASQAFPCRLIQRRLRAHQVADHIPSCQVKRSFRRHAHGQRHRTLRTKTNPLRPGLLPWLHPHSLREHVNRYRLVSCFNLPPAS